MPYGLCNAPAMFQHLMQNCLGELNLQFALIYLDNVIIYSRMQEDHLTHPQAVLDHFTHHGLKLKPSKCHFLKKNITYLGHEISAKGMLPGQEGIQKITNMGPPLPLLESGSLWELLDTSVISSRTSPVSPDH